MGLFDSIKKTLTSIADSSGITKLKEGLQKTRAIFVDRLLSVLGAGRTIDEALLSEIEEILITSDIGVTTTMHIMQQVKDNIKRDSVDDATLIYGMIKDEIRSILQSISNPELEDYYSSKVVKPFIMMMVGVNGVGKTTTIGKLSSNFKKAGKHVLIGAADTFRAAANEQLEVWAQRAGVDIIQQQHGADPAAVAFDTIQAALSRESDIVIIDTAGRLHNKLGLMQELEKISKVMKKKIPDAPHEVLLVIDATTGQNGLQQAKEFAKVSEITGIVLTKLDGTAKGGIIIPIAHELKLPVRFIGVGEGIEDLQFFNANAFVDTLFETGSSSVQD
ncbi:signal recognition particle receptor FtsY [Chlorobiota bacterium]|nr:signal recognition particle receptor FtsY [Chlorobiota bacterium]